MKKILLTLAAVCAFGAADAAVADLSKTWSASVDNAFAAGNAVFNAPVALDAAGNVIATGAYNEDVTIAGTSLEAVGTSAYIAKYDTAGNALWAVGIIGSATINNVVADADNNIYVAGQFADEVTFGTTAGETVVKNGMTLDGAPTVEQNAAFIAKYASDGKLLAVRTFIPELQPALAAVIDDWESEVFYWYTDGDVNFKITDLVAVGGEVYASAVYTGITKVEDITFDASYVNYIGMMYDDNICAAVFTLDGGLENIKIVDQISSSVNNGDYTENTYEVWNARLDINGSDMLVAYTGIGELSYQGGVLDLKQEKSTPMFIFSTFKDGKFVANKLVPTADAMIKSFNAVAGVKIIGGNGYIAGRKYNVTTELKDENEVEIYFNEAFVATVPALDVANTTIKAATIMEGDFYYQISDAAFTANGDIYMTSECYYQNAVNGHLKGEFAGNGVTYVYAADAISATDYKATAAAASASSLVFATVGDTGVDYTLYGDNSAAGIDDITVGDDNAPAVYYNLQGVQVANPDNGIYIVRRGNKVTKQLVK